MSDMSLPDQNVNEQVPLAFCQNCGKPLDAATVRRVGTAVYCEPCLETRPGGSEPAGAGHHPGAYQAGAYQAGGYQAVNAGPPPVGSNGWVAGQVAAAQGASHLPNPHLPNPGVAALLGLIPGVGAMYNEQYAKGVVHLLVFAVLVSLGHVADIFGLFAFGWICYMAIEAHHTARARRDGLPLPNPFGLNDIGERMGFGKAWPQGPDVAGAARDAVQAAAAGINAATAGFQRGGTVPPPGAAGWPAAASTPTQPGTAPGAAAGTGPWGAPADQYAQYAEQHPAQYPAAPIYGAAYVPPAYGQAAYNPPGYSNPGQAYGSSYGPPVAAVPPLYSSVYPPVYPPVLPPRNRFPAGAVWLIGLGVLFLLGTAGIFNAVPGTAAVGFGLAGLGVWIFLRHLMGSGPTMHYDGSPEFSLRVLRAMRGAIWLVVIGIFFLLDSFRLAHWGSMWPWLIILAGVMMLLERTAYNSAAAAAANGMAATPATAEASSATAPTHTGPAATGHNGNDASEGGN